jgi:hypothetical protein
VEKMGCKLQPWNYGRKVRDGEKMIHYRHTRIALVVVFDLMVVKRTRPWWTISILDHLKRHQPTIQ